MQVAEMDKVGELEGRLTALRSIRTTLEKQRAQLNDTAEQIKARRPVMTKALVDGDHHAAKRLDDLDSEERGIVRRLDGLSAHLAANASEIAPLEAELARESAIAATENRRKQFDALKQRAWARQKKLHALYCEITETFTALHSDLADLRDGFPDLLGGNEAQRIYDLTDYRTRATNEGREISPKYFGNNSRIEILRLLPPKRL